MASSVQANRLRAPTPLVLAVIALIALLAAGMVIAVRLGSAFPGDEPGLQAGLLDWIVLSSIFSGLVAWRRRPESRLGPLMIAAGFATSLSSLSSASGALPFTLGQSMDLVPFAVFFHVYLSFPSGRLPGAPERWVVCAAYFVAVGLQLVGLALGGFRPDNVLAIVEEQDLAMTLFDVQLLTLATLALTSIAVLVYRRRQSGPPLRRSIAVLVDSFVVALAMICALLVMGTFFPGEAFLAVQRTTFFVIGLAPVVFLIALLDARLARSSVGDLLVELRSDPSPRELREPIARALNDPSLELAYWLPQFGSWADPEGRAVRLPRDGDGRAATLIERNGERVAALVHDPSLEHEPELLDAVSAAAAIALENGRLHAELKARLEELEGSRVRVIEAGQEERKRLERNLHDGAQQRLIALSLELGLLGNRMGDDPAARARIERARAEIATSLEELRNVARGLHPAVLSGHGLAVALESLAATSAVPVELKVTFEGRVDEPLEVAAYYVVSESLTNVAKHACAGSASVEVVRLDGKLVIEVIDDGVGGADTERGTGLRGLADRVEALGGRLRIWTPRGGGTRVRAELPCA
jgi:signal transduction histidine kinase